MKEKILTLDKSVKISSELYFLLKELAILEHRKIGYLMNKAVENYLKLKKKFDFSK
jgi:predicted transcriptional regulator